VKIGHGLPLVVIGERINPTGRKRMARAVEEGDFRLLQEEAVRQVEKGAHVLDVNVGVSGIDEPKALERAVRAIREVTGVPLCIDSALPEALEAGLKACEGKALVNSVNGEKRKLEQVLPLVKDYGAAVIGLTMDDAGIPPEASRRLEIAQKILDEALARGIPAEDVIIDPLAMAVCTDSLAARATIEALRAIRDRLGVNQTLGVSNVSFGLPERHAVNGIFLAVAAASGLTCCIIDPTVWEVRRAALISDLLMGHDSYCMRFISAYRAVTRESAKPQAGGRTAAAEGIDSLRAFLCKKFQAGFRGRTEKKDPGSVTPLNHRRIRGPPDPKEGGQHDGGRLRACVHLTIQQTPCQLKEGFFSRVRERGEEGPGPGLDGAERSPGTESSGWRRSSGLPCSRTFQAEETERLGRGGRRSGTRSRPEGQRLSASTGASGRARFSCPVRRRAGRGSGQC
jgi:5-methyltetrahydrofolate--homocysteine methyltransferase